MTRTNKVQTPFVSISNRPNGVQPHTALSKGQRSADSTPDVTADVTDDVTDDVTLVFLLCFR